MSGKIGYDNLFTASGVTVTTSDEATGYEKENAYDWLSYDWWKQNAAGTSWIRASFGSAQTADYIALFGHNLGTAGASFKAQYSTNGGSSWNDAHTAVSPSDDNTQFVEFTSQSAADWRFHVVTSGTQAIVAGVLIGQALEFQRGIRPGGFVVPSMAINTTHKTHKSERGVFLGGSAIREGVEGKINLVDVDPSWVRTYWEPFRAHAMTPRPFVISWDPTNYNDEAVFAYAKDGRMPAPNYDDPLYMRAGFDYVGTL